MIIVHCYVIVFLSVMCCKIIGIFIVVRIFLESPEIKHMKVCTELVVTVMKRILYTF